MSETGIAIRDNLFLNNLNPASYASIQTITQIAEFGLYYERNKIVSNNDTQYNNQGNISAINFWFKGKPWWGATVGMSPYSNINYNITTTRNFDQTEESSVRYKGEGGLTQFYFGNGFQVNKNVSVGINLSYIRGNIEKEAAITSGQFEGISITNQTFVHSPAIDYGVQYGIHLNNKRSITLGATYANKVQLNTSRNVYVLHDFDSLYTNNENISDYQLPEQIGTGIAYQTPLHVVAVDLKFKNWRSAKLEDDVKLQNTQRLSIGYEFKGKQVATNNVSFISLRAGAFIQNSYLVLNNKSYNEYGFTLGTGLPMNGNFGVLNLSYNYNSIGTSEKRLIYQSAHIIVIDITLRDIWGIRRRFD